MSSILFRKQVLGLFLTGMVWTAAAQDPGPEKYAETITIDDLKVHLSILASDSLGGRGTGQVGQELAAMYLADQFHALGLKESVESDSGLSYFQSITLERIQKPQALIEFDGEEYNTPDHVVSLGNKQIPEARVFKTVFIGQGREQDMKGLKLAKKAVVFFGDSPDARSSTIALAKEKGARIFLIFNVKTQSDFDQYRSRSTSYRDQETLELAIPEDQRTVELMIPPQLAAELVGLELDEAIRVVDSEEPLRKLKIRTKSKSVIISTSAKSESFVAKNVLGYLPGGKHPNELLVITAHYDHLGKTKDVIFNGADDDGSGTSAILEIAQAFVLAAENGQTPNRSLLFMAVTAEEVGLLGSEYYVENPVFELENTVVNLNIDMIGRTDDRHENEDYIYLIGSDKLSQELHHLSEGINQEFSQLELDYRYNDENDPNRFYYRSDHYNFAKNNIPVIFYFSGVHEDYHRPTDTVDKIQFSKIVKTARLIFHTAWEIANREDRIEAD